MNQYMIVHYNSLGTTFTPAETLDAAYSNVSDLLRSHRSSATEADTLSIVDTATDYLVYYQRVRQDIATKPATHQPNPPFPRLWLNYIQTVLDRFSLALR